MVLFKDPMDDATVHPETEKHNGNSISVQLEDETEKAETYETGRRPNSGASVVETEIIESHECDDTCKEKFPIHCAADSEDCDDEQLRNLISSSNASQLTELDCQGATILLRLLSPDKWRKCVEEVIELILKRVTGEGKLDTPDQICEFVNVQKPSGLEKTALHYVCEQIYPSSEHVKVATSLVELFLSYGSDASLGDCDGNTPLHTLAGYKGTRATLCAEMMVDSMKNSKDALNNDDRSALHIAAYSGNNKETLQMLLDKGCSTSPVKIDEETGEEIKIPIIHSCVAYVYDDDEMNIECIKIFIKSLSADEINAKYTLDDEESWKGRTAMHVACFKLYPNVLRCLLEHEHIDPFAVDDGGRSALHIIADFGFNVHSSEFIDILLGKKNSTDEDHARRVKLFEMTDAAKETALDITIRRDSTALSRALILNHPNDADDWMEKELMRQIYYKVPEALLPIMDQYISFENKNYEANDELFSANIGSITGCWNNYTIYGITPEKLPRETDLLAIMIDSNFVTRDETESVLGHPVVQVFIRQKWKKLRHLFWLGMIFKCTWAVLYLCFVIDVFWIEFPYTGTSSATPNNTDNTNTASTTTDKDQNVTSLNAEKNSSQLETWHYIVGIFMIVSTILIFTSRTLISVMTVGWKRSFSGINITYFLFTGLIIATIIPVCTIGILPFNYAIVSGTVVMLAFIAMWECRNVPLIGIYADVFFTAVKNLLLLMIAFTPLLVGFSIAISFMLRGSKSFQDLHWSLVKILAMMLGEVNFDDLFFSSDYQAPFRTVAILLMTLFIICVPIVMFNLLLGFTISDVQALESASELKVLMSTLEEIIVLERVVLSLPMQKIIPQKILQRFMIADWEWNDECRRFGIRCEIQMEMWKIPRKIREKIREIARKQPLKKVNQPPE